LKHYVGYSASTSGKDRTPIAMSERMLREYYLVPFHNAIKNGAMTVMVNSADINGTPVHANYHILTEILKEEMKFDGFAVTD
jgi:beta-glucosidase